jgi:hypothetical protein
VKALGAAHVSDLEKMKDFLFVYRSTMEDQLCWWTWRMKEDLRLQGMVIISKLGSNAACAIFEISMEGILWLETEETNYC